MSYRKPTLKPLTEQGSYSGLGTLAVSFRRALLAQNKAPRTVQTYIEAVEEMGRFLAEQGMPSDVPAIAREHVEAYIGDLLSRPHKVTGKMLSPATAHNRYKRLQQFFRWCEEEGEIERSPMERMKPPAVPEKPVQVLGEEELKRRLKTCEGKAFFEAGQGYFAAAVGYGDEARGDREFEGERCGL